MMNVDKFLNTSYIIKKMRKKGTRVLISNRKEMLAKSKRSISPVIATVLLIVIVIILALIIFLWAKGFIKENVQKQGKSADIICGEVNLEVNYFGTDIEMINNGNVPIYRLEIKGKSGGSIEIIGLGDKKNSGLAVGQSMTISDVSSYDKVMVFPVILGEVKTSRKAYTCKNSFDAELQ